MQTVALKAQSHMTSLLGLQVMLDKLPCIQICPVIVILYHTTDKYKHFLFHINLALKFYNLVLHKQL